MPEGDSLEFFATEAAEPGYLHWIESHPAGFVANTARPNPRANYLVVHSANCGYISASAAGGGRLTGRAYQKVCALTLEELEQWARDTVGGELSPCGRCMSAENRPARPARHPTRTIVPAATDEPAAELLAPGRYPQRWEPGEVYAELPLEKPLLASWESKTNPAQIRLQRYLDEIEDAIQDAGLPATGCFIDLHVDVEMPQRLERHYDLENYLTPIAGRLGHHRLVFARATKYVGGGSHLIVGRATKAAPLDGSWQTAVVDAGPGAGSRAWQARIRNSLVASGVNVLPPGPVSVDIAFRCRESRNWVNLWKPAGDGMGPVLGEPVASNPFHPADDRIVQIQFHRETDASAGNAVHVGMGWAMA